MKIIKVFGTVTLIKLYFLQLEGDDSNDNDEMKRKVCVMLF